MASSSSGIGDEHARVHDPVRIDRLLDRAQQIQAACAEFALHVVAAGAADAVVVRKAAAMPAGGSWARLYGVAILGGIGFTMSLFIGTLAFADAARHAEVRLGVLAGSLLSALVGYAALRLAPLPRTQR